MDQKSEEKKKKITKFILITISVLFIAVMLTLCFSEPFRSSVTVTATPDTAGNTHYEYYKQ